MLNRFIIRQRVDALVLIIGVMKEGPELCSVIDMHDGVSDECECSLEKELVFGIMDRLDLFGDCTELFES